ncbi:MAG: hypothetical protein PVF49_02470 [Anaerolineales bacterium]
MKRPFFASFILILATLNTGCSALFGPPKPGSVLFQDDFSRPESGWDHYQDEQYSSDYLEDGYQIEIFEPNILAWATPGLSFDDSLVMVEAIRTQGPADNAFGLICRYQDPDNFYFFLISSDGFAGIGQRLDGERQLLTDEHMLPSSAIQSGHEPNLILASCVGPRLELYVNGQFVAAAEDDTWAAGDVGLIAGSYEGGEVTIQFDNFSVQQP